VETRRLEMGRGQFERRLQSLEERHQARWSQFELEIRELRKALGLFARVCGECKQWKPKAASGWHRRPTKRVIIGGGWVSTTFVGTSTDGTADGMQYSYTCPECMAKLKPVEVTDKEASGGTH
jgi:hypothetical protein